MKTIAFPILKTKRLLLRKLEKTDAATVLFLRSDPVITQYIERKIIPKNVEDALVFINDTNHKISNNKLIYWSITLKDNPQMIGAICLWNFSKDKKNAEVGYELNPAFQKKGIMTEALQAVLDFGFQQLNLDKVEAFTHRENESSKQLLSKNNFKYIPQRNDKDNKNNIIFEIEK